MHICFKCGKQTEDTGYYWNDWWLCKECYYKVCFNTLGAEMLLFFLQIYT